MHFRNIMSTSIGGRKMRYVENMPNATLGLLRRIHKKSKYERTRHRSHCIILSYKRYSVPQLIDILEESRNTIYNWLTSWEKEGFVGLYDKKGKGRKPTFTKEKKEQIVQWVKQFPKNIKKVLILIQEFFDVSVCKRTIKRILKSFNFTWRRVRKKVKGTPDPIEYKQKSDILEEYVKQHKAGEIDLRFGDGTGFSLCSCIPYAWQEKGKTIEIETSKSKRINVYGFMNINCQLQAYTSQDTINSELLIAFIDDFCKKIKKKTVLVLDNASIHTSNDFLANISQWKKKNLEIFFLPKYSPQLNLIEILWRFMKYEWIDFNAYKSFESLAKYVDNILNKFGTEVTINFV